MTWCDLCKLPPLREVTFADVLLADDYSDLPGLSFQGSCHWALPNRQWHATCDVHLIQAHIGLCSAPLSCLYRGLLSAPVLRFWFNHCTVHLGRRGTSACHQRDGSVSRWTFFSRSLYSSVSLFCLCKSQSLDNLKNLVYNLLTIFLLIPIQN